MILLIPIAGPDEAFARKRNSYGKMLAEIDGIPLIEHVWKSLSGIKAEKVVFVIKKKDSDNYQLDQVLKLMIPGCSVVFANGPTAGAACTCLLAIDHISRKDELVVVNGDQVIETDFEKTLIRFRKEKYDSGTIIFDSIHPRWSFVKLDEFGFVIEAAEKRPISRYATAGFFYFKRGEMFIDGAMDAIRKSASVNNQYFICPVLNQLILKNLRVGVHKIERAAYHSLSTPKNVNQFESKIHRSNEGF
jgi:dTDP-glucose pyrophosphorylase